MKIGDDIEIKYLNEHSMIVGLEPFEFPFEAQMMLMPFLTLGLIMAILLYLRIRKTLSLYNYGVVKSAELIAMNVQRGLPITGIGQGAKVHYQYETTTGMKVLGKSFTNDHSLLNGMKQGDMINIFVSEIDESKSCLIPKMISYGIIGKYKLTARETINSNPPLQILWE
ncbi:MAG: hypothetical protein R8G66_31150 [Cytophagales bacterium]|nr:hypothetical protein [Cytophagales bacterium]